ncbi:hypothetical protein GCM10010274_20180 [Streptomyces lavendofoliae]|uniref:Uncharacterized protein n=1 Tax=Streptomyces lavendofoliae TaxID=67314 RepID=A0A918M490_9ACTN|nr:hypothetical protein GCM10010274_20180 [Streptomyces lavendofoliae]
MPLPAFAAFAMRLTLTGAGYAEDPAVGNGRVRGEPGQAAELELPAALDVAGLESDDEEPEEELDAEPDELVEAEEPGFDAGELLDDAPRLSLR